MSTLTVTDATTTDKHIDYENDSTHTPHERDKDDPLYHVIEATRRIHADLDARSDTFYRAI